MQRIVVVSGGGTGIGRAIARAQSLEGDRVLILGRRPHVLEKAAREINEECGNRNVTWRSADVTDIACIKDVADFARSEFGTIHAVVNNVGITGRPYATLEEAMAVWRDTFHTNVLSAVMLTTALLPLLPQPGGKIIVISSMAGKNGGGSPHYAASKAALNCWVTSFAGDIGPKGITINAVLPAYTPDTEIFGDGLPKEIHDKLVARTTLGRAGRSADSAGAVRYLLSSDGDYVTGMLMEVCGGEMPPRL